MAVQNLPAIVEKLLAGGRDAAEPMAIISKASTPEQTVLETTLGGKRSLLKMSGEQMKVERL
jgi:uroporphyrin-III C-methyltransferase